MSKRSLKLSAFFLAAVLAAADRYQASEPHMGTVVSITLYAESPDQAQEAFLAAFARIEELNSILSDYDPDSELSLVCKASRPLSPDLAAVLRQAQQLAADSGGAFDITAGPLTRLWREARAAKRLPEQEQIRAALQRTGYRKLALSAGGRRARCLANGMQLDAGGIAKGYAADQALLALKRKGIRSALAAVSGDIAMSDPPPGAAGWRVRIQNEVRTLANAAVSTSGDEFQFADIDGVRYSHIIDPRTGMPVRNGRTVSVIATSGIEADSLATAISVLGASGKQAADEIIDIREPMQATRLRSMLLSGGLLLAAAGASGETKPYDRMYVFGDSYSDTGAGYLDGNGPTAVAYLAERLGLTLVPSNHGAPEGKSLNFAVSGAQTGSGEGRRVKDALLGYGMKNQVNDFATQVRGRALHFAPESTLFFIAGGLNDGRLSNETTAANLKSILRDLYELGARKFAIALLPTAIPGFADVGKRLNPVLTEIARAMRAELRGSTIYLSQWGPFFDEVMRNPGRYGIRNTTDACAGRALFNQDATPCASPETYYYYHAGHPSTAVHRIVGGKLYEEAIREAGR